MEDSNYEDKYENERKVNKAQVETTKRIVCDNIKFPIYYNTYVDKTVNLRINSKCACPMHEESEPSFRYFETTNTFSCFGKCHVAGDVIKFHETYLKYLLKTGQVTKFRAITKMKPEDINYYTAMEDLVNIYHLTAPSIFIDATVVKKVTEEDLFNFFKDTPKKLELTKDSINFNEIDKAIIINILHLKRVNSDAYNKAYKDYIKILTSGPDILDLTDKLEQFRRELEPLC